MATEVLTPTSVPFTVAHLTSPLPAKSSKEKSALSLGDDQAKSGGSGRVHFDPKKHLEFTPPSKTYSMKELGFSDNAGVSPTGVSEPFPLFSAEAINEMRKEVLSDAVWSKYKYSSNLAQCMLRGYAPECGPFVYDAWHNPETLAIISKIAGVDLVPVMDWEIGHVNISVKSEEEKQREVENAIAKSSDEEDDKPIVDWHTDSYPFVCVTMLSDCTDMIGGETALRKGDGSILKVRGPQMGCAVVLQGRYIEHQALRALGATERISMVTSFRPRSCALPDDTVLTTVRPISDLSELYFQFSEYRLEMLEERIRTQLKEMRERKRARRPFDTRGAKHFFAEQEKFLAHMNKEMVDDDRVIKGFTDDSHLLTEELRERDRKKTQVWVSANWAQNN